MKDVGEETGISYRTLQNIIPHLVKEGILKYTRTEGKAKLYQINRDSRVVRELQKISRESDFEYAEKIVKPVSLTPPEPL